MIARSWHGVVPQNMGNDFHVHLQKTGVAEALATHGNTGALIHRVDRGNYAHFFMISYWVDHEAIRGFAGPEPHIAVEYPGDEHFGLVSDPIVLHYEVSAVPDEFPLG